MFSNLILIQYVFICFNGISLNMCMISLFLDDFLFLSCKATLTVWFFSFHSENVEWRSFIYLFFFIFYIVLNASCPFVELMIWKTITWSDAMKEKYKFQTLQRFLLYLPPPMQSLVDLDYFEVRGTCYSLVCFEECSEVYLARKELWFNFSELLNSE